MPKPGSAGLVVVDKSEGPTSHDAVASVRRALSGGGHRPKVGHLGTLDPFATGVLPVLVGAATRLAPYYGGLPKVYEAEMQLGVATDSLDPTGSVVARAAADHVDASQLEAAMAAYVGERLQEPPMHSAVKLGGKPLYERARRGEVVARPPRPVTIHELRLLGFDRERGRVRFHAAVSSGTYVRVLAAEIATRCGTVAHLVALRRLAAGPFGLERAVALPGEDLRGRLLAAMLPLRTLLPELPELRVAGEQEERVRHGRVVPWGGGTEPRAGDVRIVDAQGELLAVGRLDAGGTTVQPKVVLSAL